MSERLEAIRAAHAGKNLVDPAKAPSRAEMREQSYSADARKARELVKSQAWESLFMLAAAMLPLILEKRLKDRLGAAIEEMAEANAEYRSVELLPPGMVAWAGGFGVSNGILPRFPDAAPEHKRRFANAWNVLLTTVNEITKVGLTKRSRHTPIVLQADIDAIEIPKVQVQGFSDDGW